MRLLGVPRRRCRCDRRSGVSYGWCVHLGAWPWISSRLLSKTKHRSRSVSGVFRGQHSRPGSICPACLQSSVVLRRSVFFVAIEARTEHDAVFSSHANCRGSFSDCFERIFHLKPRFVRRHTRPCRQGQLVPFHVRFDVDPTRSSRARTGVRPARRR